MSTDPCEKVKEVDLQIKGLTQTRRVELQECNKSKYLPPSDQPSTMIELIQYIYENQEELKDCNKLFEKFPEINERPVGGLSKPYIFEALWKIIFLLYLDNLTPTDYSRVFKKSIEGNKTIGRYKYIQDKINSSSDFGIADLYFVLEGRDTESHTETSDIRSECEVSKYTPAVKDAYLFTSKFFKDEKAIGNYDVAEIVLNAQKIHGIKEYKIVCLVHSRADFIKRIDNSSKEALKDYIDSNLIYDYGDLATIFYPKLWRWLRDNFNPDNIDDIKRWQSILGEPGKSSNNVIDILRFHQRYVVEYTNDRIDENLASSNNPGKFIWGAVARSGKSYMIGGLVAKRKPRFVILVLGAVNETRSQFVGDLFKKYTDLKDEYIVLEINDLKSQVEYTADKKYVLVISQESIRAKVNSANNNTIQNQFDKNVIDNVLRVLTRKENDKIIFFDEIHQGGSKDLPLQQKVIEFFFRGDVPFPKPLLILVSATYGKPYKRYGSTFEADDSHTECILVEWTYEMIMKMKRFSQEMVSLEGGESIEKLIDKDSSDYADKMLKLKSITDMLIYNGKTYEDISYEYTRYPELKYLLPTLKSNYVGPDGLNKTYDIEEEDGEKINIRTDIRKVFELKNRNEKHRKQDNIDCKKECDNDKPGKEENEICKTDCDKGIFEEFKYKTAVTKTLTYISDYVYGELLSKTYDYNATGSGDVHSQMWFLPTTMTWTKTQLVNDDGPVEDDNEDKVAEDDNEVKAVENPKHSVVATMMRNLAILIVDHPKFSNFNVCVVHSQKGLPSIYYKNLEGRHGGKVYFNCIKLNNIPNHGVDTEPTGNKYQSVKECITNIENESRSNNKSLIILTAQRLRLGISLPCVDVAIHMDNIKSYDILYQTMFRVLTDRQKKKRGYFVDMIYNRGIEFIYKYARAKKGGHIENVTRDEIKTVMYDFDAGLIRSSYQFSSVDTPINSYEEVASAFLVSENGDDDAKREKMLRKIDKEERKEETGEQPIKVAKPAPAENIQKRIEDDMKKILKKYSKDIAKMIRGYDFQKHRDEPDEPLSERKKTFKKTVIEKTDEDEDEDEDEDDMFDIKSVLDHIKNIFTMILLFDETEEGITLERVINPASYAHKNKGIRRCTDNDKLIYCYLAGIQEPPKIGDRLLKKDQVFKRGSQITRHDGVIGEVVRIKKIKPDIEDIEDNEIITQYSVKWNDSSTKIEYATENQFVKDLKPVVGRIVGILSTCRKLSECAKKGEQIRHTIGDHIKIGTYAGDNKIQSGDLMMSLNQFSQNHYLSIKNERRKENNAWAECEIRKHDEWISMERLLGTTILGYEVQWENASAREPYSKRRIETDTIQLSNAFANDLSQLDNDEIRNKIDKQFSLIRYLIDQGQDEKDVLINLYLYIKENMDKIKDRLKTKSFNKNVPGFCPADFISNDNVLEIIRNHLTPKVSERTLFGEVFTPLELVCEMLSHIPASVWKDPTLKWLDPANGIGNFPVVVYYKLMDSLPDEYDKDGIKYSTTASKSKHIIEKMLYMNELNKINIGVCKRIFKLIDSHATPNIVQGDFLEEKTTSFNGISSFDVIMGNPPYNKNGTGKGGGVIWKDFVFDSVKKLKEGGYLTFVHPTGWRKLAGERASAGDVWQRFKKLNLVFVKISDKKIKHFPTVDYYVLQNISRQHDTHVISEFETRVFDGKINLYNKDFIPHFINKEVWSILDKVFKKEGEKFDIVRNQSFKPTKEDMQKKGTHHAYYYNPSDKDYLFVNRKYESDSMPAYIDQRKIVMTFSKGKTQGVLYPKYYSTPMGTTSNTMYQLIGPDDNVENIMMLLNSELINFILKITQYSEPPNYINEFKILNQISKPNGTKLNNENDVYTYFGINNKEKELIKELVTESEETSVAKKTRKKKGGVNKRHTRRAM
jgi:hypothetical protein